jgi:hypothetical protein
MFYETTTIEVLFLGQGGEREVKFVQSPIDITRLVDLDGQYGSGQVIEVPRTKRHYITEDPWEIAEIEKSQHFKNGSITKKVKTTRTRDQMLATTYQSC